MSSAEALLLLIHLAATAVMTGIIWFVQVVHYPLFADVDAESFVAYELRNTRRTTWVVLPAMLVELASAVIIVVVSPHGVPGWLGGVGLALVAVVWVSTGLLQVPAHRVLSVGASPQAVASLVRGNWLRTAGWSLRLLIAVAMLAVAIPAR